MKPHAISATKWLRDGVVRAGDEAAKRKRHIDNDFRHSRTFRVAELSPLLRSSRYTDV
jgi:hypothetical protein